MGYSLNSFQWSDFYYVGILAVLACVGFLVYRYSGIKGKLDLLSSEKKLALALFCTVSFGVLVVYWNFLFGNEFFVYSDIGSDTRESYHPYYVNVVKQIQEGTFSFWNFDVALGTSIANQWLLLLDPFNLIVLGGGLVFGVGAIPFLLVFAHIIKVYLAVFLCSAVLKRYGISLQGRLLASVLFGFSGFIMLWGQHYWFGSAYVAMIALLLCIERCLEQQTWVNLLLLCLTSAVLFAWSVYVAYMIILFAFIYFLIRAAYMPEVFNLKDYLKTLVKPVCFVVIGFLLAAPFLFSASYNLLGESARLSSDASLLDRMINAALQLSSPSFWYVLVSRFMSNNLLATAVEVFPLGPNVTNYYEFPQVATSVAIFVFFIGYLVYLVKAKLLKRRRLLQILCLVLGVGYFSSLLLPMLLYAGMAGSWRSTLVLMFPLVAMIAVIWDYYRVERKLGIKVLIVGAVLSLLCLASFFLTAGHLARFAIAGQVVILIAFTLIMCLSYRRKSAGLAVLSLAILITGSFYDAFVTTNIRHSGESNTIAYVHEARSRAVDGDTREALDYLKQSDDSFYRVEKTYADWTLQTDALLQDYKGASNYGATLAPSVLSFYSNLWPECSPEGQGTYMQAYYLDTDEPKIATLLNIEYILSREPLEYEWVAEIAQFGDVYIYGNLYARSLASVYSKAVSQEDISSCTPEEKRALLTEFMIVEEDAGLEPWIDVDAIDSVQEKYHSLSNDFTFTSPHDALVEGMVKVNEDSLLCLAIPDVQGWSVFVDGEEVETFNAQYGFIGLELSAGEHHVEARFMPVGFKEGLIVMPLGVLALLVSLVLMRRSARNAAQEVAP